MIETDRYIKIDRFYICKVVYRKERNRTFQMPFILLDDNDDEADGDAMTA